MQQMRGKETFELVSMKGIRSAQGNHPLVCLVCEGVKNHRDISETNVGCEWPYCQRNPIGEWVKKMEEDARAAGEVFDPALWPKEDQYDTEARGTPRAA